MRYALLVYGPAGETVAEREARPLPARLAARLELPDIAGWARLHAAASATTVRSGDREPLLTDGPFIDSKEYLAGLFLVDAANLDGALAVAGELLIGTSPGTAIEVRPVIEGRLRGA